MLSEMDDMEGIGTEEHVVVGSCNNNDATHVIKGKRTKRRLRQLSPCAVAATATAAMTSSCSSASGGGGGSFSSTTTTTTFEGTDQEEEDMANCLILLAQGKREEQGNPHHHQQHMQQGENHVDGTNNKVQVTEKAMKSGFYIYECKTCNRTFPSFQALGGHRASHKKPKTQEEKKSSPPPISDFEEADYKQSQIMKNVVRLSTPPVISLELGCGVVVKSNKPNKMHECSICGSEFTSGQALGGHMRRHRASINNNNNNNSNVVAAVTTFDDVVDVKTRNVLELDLNLPAPEDDLRDFQFPPAATQKSVVLPAAPALVGCHY